jgi:hypothetical protein
MKDPYIYLEKQRIWKQNNPDKLRLYAKNYYYKTSVVKNRQNREEIQERYKKIMELYNN